MANVLDIDGAKSNFFDKGAVIAAVGKAKARGFARGGGLTRTTAQRSLKYKAKVSDDSPPGQPPFVHRSDTFQRSFTNKKTGEKKTRATSPLKELVQYAFDFQTHTAVIGPALFRNTKAKSYRVPEMLEKGGTAFVWLPARADDRTMKPAGNEKKKGRMIRAKYAPRPAMMLALQKVGPKIAEGFKGSVNDG